MTQKTFNLLVFPSIKASSFTANQLRRVARECFDLILMLSLNQTSDSNNRRDWLLSFRLTCLVFYIVMQIVMQIWIQYIMYCISSEIYYHRRLKKHVEVKKAIGFRTSS